MKMNDTAPCNIARALLGLVSFFVMAVAATETCAAQDRTVKVSLSAAKTTTSGEIQIVESTQMAPGHGAMSISHQTRRVGIYHRGEKAFVLWNGALQSGARLKKLPQALISAHGISMKDFGDGRLGVEFNIVAPDPGLYIITTTWTLITRDAKAAPIERKGNPVLLFVEPSEDYDRQEPSSAKYSEGLTLQAYLEETFDSNPNGIGILLPRFGAVNPGGKEVGD
jgi:hypothetical protein